MTGWELLVAAVGGTLLGVGAGLILGRRHERTLARRLTRAETRMRSTVIPLLERRAEALGLPAAQRAPSCADGVELAARLAEAIQGFEEGQDLPYTDTLEADRAQLSRQQQGGRT